MRNIRLDLEYDGRNYHGWQCQPNRPTIEATLQRAVERVVNHSITIYSSGRTDAGVHAEQHVAHFHTPSRIGLDALPRALNSLLPNDIAVYRVFEMPMEWSARRHAIEREYRYTYFTDRSPSALWGGRVFWVRDSIDVDSMREAARYLIGRHDFSAFRSTHCDAENPIRTLLDAHLEQSGLFLHLHLRGHAFLRHQVRIIAGTLLEVGRGKRPPKEIRDILASRERERAGKTLAAHGLTLTAVRYREDPALGIVYRRYKTPLSVDNPSG